jgi:hypothetical protein
VAVDDPDPDPRNVHYYPVHFDHAHVLGLLLLVDILDQT